MLSLVFETKYLVFDVNESCGDGISFAAFPSVYLSFDTMYLGWCVSYLEWERCTIWKPIVLANNLSFVTMNVFGDCKFGNNLETCGAGKSFEASPQAGRHTVAPGSYYPLYLYTLLHFYEHCKNCECCPVSQKSQVPMIAHLGNSLMEVHRSTYQTT